jgi:tRNA(Ile)-lysidine synthase
VSAAWLCPFRASSRRPSPFVAASSGSSGAVPAGGRATSTRAPWTRSSRCWAATARRRSLAAGLEARCRYGTLEIAARAAPSAPLPTRDVPAPGRYAVPELGCVLEVRADRAERVPWPLAARSRRPGDRFRPAGGRGSKLLRRWLIDRKVPRERRDALLVLAAGDHVLAVPELEVIAAGEGAAGAGLAARLCPAR